MLRRSFWGSPPPMRGKVEQVRLFTFRVRITPAYAGKSVKLLSPLVRVPGSPPPMRGKVPYGIR